MNMNTKKMLIVAGGIALSALPSALAGDAGDKFKLMDANGDSRVTREEYTSGMKTEFTRLDTNNDGIITATELAARQEQKKKNPLKFWDKGEKEQALSPTGKLGAADENSDGRITRAEYEAQAETMFTALDTDKDGSLTAKEVEAGDKTAPPAK